MVDHRGNLPNKTIEYMCLHYGIVFPLHIYKDFDVVMNEVKQWFNKEYNNSTTTTSA